MRPRPRARRARVSRPTRARWSGRRPRRSAHARDRRTRQAMLAGCRRPPRRAALHRRATGRIVEELLDRARDVVRPLPHAKAVDAVADHLAERRDIASDDRSFMEPGLEISNPEGFMQRRHREDVARIERGGLLAPACALDVDDALVVVTLELGDDAGIEVVAAEQ